MFFDDGLRKVQSNQNQFINSRIQTVERNFGNLCENFAGYARKKAKLRDKGDELTKALNDYGEAETLNKTLRSALIDVADTVEQVQDYRNEEISRIEKDVVAPLSNYRKICRDTQEELRHCLDLRRKDVNRKTSLERSQTRYPQSRPHLDPESNLKKAEENALKSCVRVEEKIDTFEEKKIEDMKTILMNFVKIELAFHAKSVEFFTKAYGQVSRINCEDDLEDFQSSRDVYDRELRNALGLNTLRSDFEIENEAKLSPVILGPKKKSSKEKDVTKSIDSLKIQDYEEIMESDSSS